MKEFTTAVEEIAEDREAQIQEILDSAEKNIADLVAAGMDEADAKIIAGRDREGAERELDLGKPVGFKIDGRLMLAYPPTDGQLAFMLATLGRGQTSDGRFASIINVMLSCLRDSDKDYFESRLLEQDIKKRIGVKKIEEVFEYLTEEWFR